MSGEANKILKSVVFAGIFTLALAGCQKEARATLAETYFPLNVGNSWTYTNGTEELTFTIIGTEEIGGHTYYRFDKYFSVLPPLPNGEVSIILTNVSLRYDLIANRILRRGYGADEFIRYDFTGDEWDPGTGIGGCQLKEIGLVCDVPAGEFSDCIKFQFGLHPSAGPDAAAYGEYLAPNVGVIKFVMPGGDYPDRLEGQDITFVLESYTIIPEPVTLLLFGFGVLFLRRRN